LTGIFSQILGSPGLIQYWELKDLLAQRAGDAQQLELGIQTLAEAQAALENDPITQKREIRRVLGFVGEDEIVFEFSDPK
jgi:cell division protein FtsB